MRFPNAAIGLGIGIVGLALFCMLGVFPVRAQNSNDAIKVVGIVDLPNYRRALLHHLDRQTPFGEYIILMEGERVNDLEVIDIKPEERTVKIRLSRGADLVLKMGELPPQAQVNGTAKKKTVELREISLHPMLDLYSQFSGRTILRHPQLSVQNFTLSAAPADPAEAATVLEKALAEREIVSIKDGDKFLMVVPKSEEKNVHPVSVELKQSVEVSTGKVAEKGTKQGDSEIIPAGIIDFRKMDLANVAAVYAMLTNAEPDRENLRSIHGEGIVFTTRTALNKSEAKYALDTLFAWQGFKTVRADDGTVRLEKIESK